MFINFGEKKKQRMKNDQNVLIDEKMNLNSDIKIFKRKGLFLIQELHRFQTQEYYVV